MNQYEWNGHHFKPVKQLSPSQKEEHEQTLNQTVPAGEVESAQCRGRESFVEGTGRDAEFSLLIIALVALFNMLMAVILFADSALLAGATITRSLGYSNPGYSAQVMLNDRRISMDTGFAVNPALTLGIGSSRKLDAGDGYSLFASPAIRVFSGRYHLGAGANINHLVTSKYSKTSVYPFATGGVRVENIVLTGTYNFTDHNTRNRGNGASFGMLFLLDRVIVGVNYGYLSFNQDTRRMTGRSVSVVGGVRL